MFRRKFIQSMGVLSSGTTLAGQLGERNVDVTRSFGKGLYHNPVFEPTFGSPSVIRTDDGWYYAYAGSANFGDGAGWRQVPIIRSPNLVDWEYVGEVFQGPPEWLDSHHPNNRGLLVWAPDITYYKGTYRLYYALVDLYPQYNRHNSAIGVATADTPAGPWTDQGKVFSADEIGVVPSIDPMFVVDGGTPYIVWGGHVTNGIYIVELSEDGRRPLGDPIKIAGSPFEGPYVIKRDGYYYLFIVAGVCCRGPQSSYRQMVARSTSLTGPYKNRDGANVLNAMGTVIYHGNEAFGAPGHNAVARDDAGQEWIVTHAVDRDNYYLPYGGTRRPLVIDPITWKNGWPTIEHQSPSTTQRRPTIKQPDRPRLRFGDLTVSASSVNANELLTVSTSARNTGGIGVVSVHLSVDNRIVDTKEVVVATSATEISFDTRLYRGGDRAVAIGTSPQQSSPSETVTVTPRPAEYTYNGLRVPELLDSGENGTITAEVTNIGSQKVTKNVQFIVDGEPITSRPVSLGPGGRTDVSFSFSTRTLGEYSVTIGTADAKPVHVIGPVPDSYATFANTGGDFGPSDGWPGATFGVSDEGFIGNAAGRNMWTFADEYGTMYEKDGLGPAGEVTVEVLSQERTFRFARAGIIIRNDVTEPGDAAGYLFFALLPDEERGGFQFAWDSSENGYIDSGFPIQSSPSYPSTLKVTKDGTSFEAFYSTDDESTWQSVGHAVTIDSADDYQDVGLLVSSLSPFERSLVEFGQFTIKNG